MERRLLLVGGVIYAAFRITVALRLMVLPLLAELLLTALLRPLAARLARAGLPALAATWATMLAMAAGLAALGTLAVSRVRAGHPGLIAEVSQTGRQIQHALAGRPCPRRPCRAGCLAGDGQPCARHYRHRRH
jgi:predicted PurR-regulated permease PerM